jgi:hypothetical protein
MNRDKPDLREVIARLRAGMADVPEGGTDFYGVPPDDLTALLDVVERCLYSDPQADAIARGEIAHG